MSDSYIIFKELILFLFGEKWLFIEHMLINMMIYGSLLTFSNSIFVLIVAYGKPSKETLTRLVHWAYFVYVIFNNSINGILNSILLSGFVLLVGAIMNLYILKILDIHAVLKTSLFITYQF